MPSTLLVQDYMTSAPVLLKPQDDATTLLSLLRSRQISGAPVVNEAGKLIGVVSVTDLISYEVLGALNAAPSLAEEDSLLHSLDIRYFREKTVGEMMSRQARSVCTDNTIQEAAHEMIRFGIHRLIVTDVRDKVEGVLSTLDITRAAADSGLQTPMVEIMSKRPVVSVSLDDTAKTALQKLQTAKVTAVLVMDWNKPAGFISQSELVAVLDQLDSVLVRDILSTKILEIDKQTPVCEAAARLIQENLRRLIVEDGGKPIGIATSTDITRAMSQMLT